MNQILLSKWICVSKLCQSDKNNDKKNEWMGFSPPPPCWRNGFPGVGRKITGKFQGVEEEILKNSRGTVSE